MNAGEHAARERVEAVYAAVDRLTPEDLSNLVLADRDLEQRTVRLADLERVADRAGRAPLLDEARTWLNEALAQRVLARAWAGAFGMSLVGRAEDIAEVRLALEDAVSVAVVEDLLDPASAGSLADPGRRILGLEPIAAPPPDATPAEAPWEPSASDWADAAASGAEAVDHEEPMAGGRDLQAWFFGVAGGFGVLATLAFGAVLDQLPLAVLASLAIAAVAWTLATYHRPIQRP